MSQRSSLTIKIEPWSILKVFFLILALIFLYIIKDIVLIFVLASFLSLILVPAVNFLEHKKITRWLGALFIYLAVLLILSAIIFSIGPNLVAEGKILVHKLPDYFKSVFGDKMDFLNQGIWPSIQNWLTITNIQEYGVFAWLSSILSGFFTLIMVLVIAFYLSIDKDFFIRQIDKFVPESYKKFWKNFYYLSLQKLGDWARGQAILCLTIGLFSYLGLLFLGIKFALILGVIAGLTEIIPYFGPLIAGSAAILVALVDDPIKALTVAVFYIVLQQLESLFVTPQVMKRAVQLNPVIGIVTMLIGGNLLGPIGILVSVPIVTIIKILLIEYLDSQKKENEKEPCDETLSANF